MYLRISVSFYLPIFIYFCLCMHVRMHVCITDVSDVRFFKFEDSDVYADVIMRMWMRMLMSVANKMRMQMRKQIWRYDILADADVFLFFFFYVKWR